jgi:hypothetical protein
MFDRIAHVREWVRRWEVTIYWDQADHSPWRTTRYCTHVATPAELRRIVQAARADPHVTAFPYRSIRVMVGDAPTRCPAGHPYTLDRREAGRLVCLDWTPCSCGGHHMLICAQPDCPHPRTADPPFADDCQQLAP